MKNTFSKLIIAGFVVILAIGIWAAFQIRRPATQNQSPNQNSYILPNNSTTVTPGSSTVATSTPMISIPIPGGKTMAVKDFLHNHETVPDTVNPGYYFLAGSIGYCLGDGTCPSGYPTNDFTISYHEVDGTFTITLLQEPLAKARSEVELFLLNRLGITQAQLCNINYWIGTPDTVNTIYAGKNLGFSFCPGATQL